MHLAFSSLFFLLRPWFAFLGLGDHIDAESRIPSHLAVGEYATASWVIHKGDARGFARLHLNVPDHLEVTPLQTSGASFDFDGSAVKLIWMDAPEEASFVIELGIRAQSQFTGGAFEPLWSYIVDGRRQDVAMTSAYLAPAAGSLSGSPLLPAPTTWEVEGARPVDDSGPDGDFDPAGFSILRSVVIEGPEVARVEFRIAGHPKNRLLRIVEQVASGCRAEHDQLEKATVRFDANELVFSWFNAPKANSFAVSYRIMGDLMACLTSLDGSAEFALGESTQVVKIAPVDWSAVQDPEGWVTEPVATASEPVQADERAVEVPAPDPGVSFRVQVLAAHTYVKGEWFKRNFGFNAAIDAESHEDWVKYTTGSFPAYEGARNLRESLASGYAFPGPFVTAYENGERITVQEALVLAQQEWIP